MQSIISFFKAFIEVLKDQLREIPSNDLESFIKFKNPQTQEELEFVMAQFEEMRRMEAKLVSRGEYGAAMQIRRTYWS